MLPCFKKLTTESVISPATESFQNIRNKLYTEITKIPLNSSGLETSHQEPGRSEDACKARNMVKDGR